MLIFINRKRMIYQLCKHRKYGYFKEYQHQELQTNSDKSALSGNIIFKHKFKKARRTLSFTADWNTLA